MFVSLIYVSRSLIVRSEEVRQIDAIVAGSIERNAQLGVRGALLFTERHFAQLLEGPEQAVDELMASIERDSRHERVTVIERKPIDGYRFPDWGLAYWGSASYMDLKIAGVLDKRNSAPLAHQTIQIYDLMRLLAQESRDGKGPVGRRSPH